MAAHRSEDDPPTDRTTGIPPRAPEPVASSVVPDAETPPIASARTQPVSSASFDTTIPPPASHSFSSPLPPLLFPLPPLAFPSPSLLIRPPPPEIPEYRRKPFPLLRLPPELRMQIFRAALVPTLSAHPLKTLNTLHALLHTSRTIRIESIPALQATTAVFPSKYSAFKFLKLLTRYERRAQVFRLSLVLTNTPDGPDRHQDNTHVPALSLLKRQCNGLQELHVQFPDLGWEAPTGRTHMTGFDERVLAGAAVRLQHFCGWRQLEHTRNLKCATLDTTPDRVLMSETRVLLEQLAAEMMQKGPLQSESGDRETCPD